MNRQQVRVQEKVLHVVESSTFNMQINSFAPLIASLRVNVLPLVNGPSRSMFTPDAKETSGTVRFTQQPSWDHQKLKLESVKTNNALQWMPFLPILPPSVLFLTFRLYNRQSYNSLPAFRRCSRGRFLKMQRELVKSNWQERLLLLLAAGRFSMLEQLRRLATLA